MKIADLVIVPGGGPIEKTIERVTHSPYCHVAGLVKTNEIFEAQAGRKTGYQGLDYYSGSDIFTCDELTDEQRSGILQFVSKAVGSKYDYGLILWEAVHYLLHIDCPYHEDGKYDCSTLWAEAYRSVGIDLCPGIEFPVPGDIALSKRLRKIGMV